MVDKAKFEELKEAILTDNLGAISRLLSDEDKGDLLSFQDPESGDTLLHTAVKNEKVGFLKKLSRLDLAPEVVNHTDSRGYSLLHTAINRGKNLEIIQALVNIPGIDVNMESLERTPLDHAIMNGNLDIVRALLADPRIDVNTKAFNITPLDRAITNGNLDIIRSLLAAPGIDVNMESLGQIPLYRAIERGNIDVIKALLAAPRIDVNMRSFGLTPLGRTPLHCAIEKGNIDVIKALLAAPGIDVNIRSFGLTPLYHALNRDDPAIFIALIMNGATHTITYIHRNEGIIASATFQLLNDNNVDNFLDTLKRHKVPLNNALEIAKTYSHFTTMDNNIREAIDEHINNSEYMRRANYIVPGLLYDAGMISSPFNYAEYIAGENFSMIEDSLEGQKLKEFFEKRPYLKPENFLKEVLCGDGHKDIRDLILGNPENHAQIATLLNGAKQHPEIFSREEMQKINAIYDQMPDIKDVAATDIQRVLYRGRKGRQEAAKEQAKAKTFGGKLERLAKRTASQLKRPSRIFKDLPGDRSIDMDDYDNKPSR